MAVDSDTGAVVAGVLGGWSCKAASPPTQFDGSYDIERLPVGHNYIIYVEPLIGLVGPGDFSDVLGDPCPPGVDSPCTAPAVNTNFTVRILPVSP